MKKERHMRGATPAPTMPFISFLTDDKRKKVHHEALSNIVEIFRKTGMKDYNVSHIDDPERNPDIPIKIGPHLFDLSFHKDLHTIVLLEVKILKIDTKRSKNG